MASVAPNRSAKSLPTVLLVADELLARLFCAEALEDAGFPVIAAPSAEGALRGLEIRDDIRILLTDITMPGLDGLALARLARERWPHIQVVPTSGWTRFNPDEWPDEVCLIPKPYQVGTVANTIRTVIERVI